MYNVTMHTCDFRCKNTRLTPTNEQHYLLRRPCQHTKLKLTANSTPYAHIGNCQPGLMQLNNANQPTLTRC